MSQVVYLKRSVLTYFGILSWWVQKQPLAVFYKKGVIKKLEKFTVQESFFNKVADLRLETILKKRLRYFLVNFAKSLGTPFLQNTSGKLLLLWVKCSHTFPKTKKQ